jgi:hypothetical protein
MYSYETLTEALADLKKRGYAEDFNLHANCLGCRARSVNIHPENFTVDEFYRFEGDSNPDDNSIVYAISSDEGIRGTLVDGYGMYSESLSSEMVEKLRVSHYD